MILVPLLLAWAVLPWTQEENEFLAAWKEADLAASGLERARARAGLLLRAGAPEAAYEEARLGLRESPHDLTLLFHEATAAVWIRDGARAQDASRRLLAAVTEASPSVPDQPAWEASARRRMDEARALLDQERALARAVSRARVVAISVMVLAGAVVLAGSRRGDARQGRSSRPVS